MMSLLVFKERLKEFYAKFDIYITPVIKFVYSYLAFWLMNRNIGFMAKLTNPLVPLVLALACSFLPYSAIDHILFREDLKKLKKDALLIDVSCDEHGAIETSRPTTTDNPIYREEGVAHYCLDHSPSLFYRSASEFISEKVSLFIKPLVWEREDRVLEGSRVIDQEGLGGHQRGICHTAPHAHRGWKRSCLR